MKPLYHCPICCRQSFKCGVCGRPTCVFIDERMWDAFRLLDGVQNAKIRAESRQWIITAMRAMRKG